jgi:hypothetical protein
MSPSSRHTLDRTYLDFLRPVMIYQLVHAQQLHEGALFTIGDRQIDQVRPLISMQCNPALAYRKKFTPGYDCREHCSQEERSNLDHDHT